MKLFLLFIFAEKTPMIFPGVRVEWVSLTQLRELVGNALFLPGLFSISIKFLFFSEIDSRGVELF